ncbi:4-alpha-glucanotransferase, partial [candidate division WOR-3 bacterium]|nr:4-alpha-glucanotransferase [candidate division WOR-3 bacterium]
MKLKRASGILLHVSSLPGPYGVGDFGPGAWQFSDWLRAGGQRWWQVLPLGPTDPLYASSPYRSVSAFAFNPLFISPDLLEREGLVQPAELRPRPSFRPARSDYAETAAWRRRMLGRAAERLRGGASLGRFVRVQRDWLEDHCLFTVLKEIHDNRPWTEWPAGLRDRKPTELRRIQREFAPELEKARRIQFIAWTQWQDLRR